MRWYRLGDGSLGIESDDVALRDRFEEIYGGCAIEEPAEGPSVVCRVSTADSGAVEVAFEDPEPLDVGLFIERLFHNRTYSVERGGPSAEQRILLPGESQPIVVRDSGHTLVIAGPGAWRPLVANLAVNRVLRLERGVLFFHASSVDVAGRGVMACGPKRSGKTTLALSLAARGHGLLGDEMAAVRLAGNVLLPVRRSLAVREGPASALATAALDRSGPDVETFPDGERRRRARIDTLFPSVTPAPVALTTVLFLRKFATRPAAEPVGASPGVLGQLTPLAASLWERSPAPLTMHLLRMVSSARLFWLDAGAPDATAKLVEHLMETA